MTKVVLSVLPNKDKYVLFGYYIQFIRFVPDEWSYNKHNLTRPRFIIRSYAPQQQKIYPNISACGATALSVEEMTYSIETDPRVKSHITILNGHRYHYLLCKPDLARPLKGTIILIHGWPDLSLTWRNQIPYFLALDYQLVCPDCLGYGKSEAPLSPSRTDDVTPLLQRGGSGPERQDKKEREDGGDCSTVSIVPSNKELAEYTFKRAAEDIRALAWEVVGRGKKVIIGGHDWGGMVAYRIALWMPELVERLFVLCTPYAPPSQTSNYISLEKLVQRFPFWGYQIQLASGEVERQVKSREDMKRFLCAVYGGKTSDGSRAFNVEKGVLWDRLPSLTGTPLMNEVMLESYVDEFMRNGIRGTLNWYRTRSLNFEEEKELQQNQITMPLLFIQAEYDSALPPAMSSRMERYCPQMTRKSVPTHHWPAWQAPELVNAHIERWLQNEHEHNGQGDGTKKCCL